MTKASYTNSTSQHKRNGRVSSCPLPQWMRTLEDKYQRLHKKITENTGVRFYNYVCNSVHDGRLSDAVRRGRYPSFQRKYFRSNTAANYRAKNSNKDTDGVQTEYAIENNENQNQENGETSTNCKDNANNIDQGKQDLSWSPETGRKYSRNNLAKSSQCSRTHRPPDHNDHESKFICSNVHDSANGITDGFMTADDFCVNVVACDTDKINADNYIEKLKNQQHNRNELKSSLSRTSKLTLRSYPSKIQAQTIALNKDKRESHAALISRSQSVNTIVNTETFTPMSAEAKHAITETIQEMNLNIQVPSENTAFQFGPSGDRQCVKSWTITKKYKSSYDLSNVLEGVSKCVADSEINNNEIYSFCNNDPSRSTTESLPEDSQKLNYILPEIAIGCTRDHCTNKFQSFRIPDIGKYDIAQNDPTFEITPPGFDSRYNDVQIVELRDSETPPPDIRQKAIEKCSEWLTKYK